jgi:alcohol dehydrogenase class IV
LGLTYASSSISGTATEVTAFAVITNFAKDTKYHV